MNGLRVRVTTHTSQTATMRITGASNPLYAMCCECGGLMLWRSNHWEHLCPAKRKPK